MKKITLILLLCIFALNCASTSITSIKNSSLANKRYGRILVIAPFSDLQIQKAFEAELSKLFYSIKVDAFTGQEIVPPIKIYNEQELNRILNKYEIDGIMVVSLTDYFTSETYIPPSSKTSGSVSIVGNYLYYNQNTQNYGGYNIKKPRMKFEIRLYDRQSGEVAWLSSSLTRGNALADINVITSSLAQAAIDTLVKDSMLMRSSTR